MLTNLQFLLGSIAAPVALSVFALLGYLVGLQQRRATQSTDRRTVSFQEKRDRTDQLLREIDSVSQQLREHLAARHAAMLHCRQKIEQMSHLGSHIKWTDDDAALSGLLDPTDELTHEIAMAYDQLRRDSHKLSELRAW